MGNMMNKNMHPDANRLKKNHSALTEMAASSETGGQLLALHPHALKAHLQGMLMPVLSPF